MRGGSLHKSSAARLRVGALVVVAALAAGCGDDEPGSAPDAFVPDSGHGDAGPGLDADAGGDARLDARLDAEGGSLDAEQRLDSAQLDANDGSAGDAGGDGGLALASAQARQVGRFGGDLRLDVVAQGAERELVALEIELLSSERATLGPVQLVPLAAPIGEPGGDGYALSTQAFVRHADVFYVRVTLVDELGGRSSAREVAIARQPVVSLGDLCDPGLVVNRCGDGLGCKGTSPATCLAGESPTISRVGYFVDELGARILIEGSDPDLDANGYHVQFFDGAGNPVAIDLDTDETTPGSTQFTEAIPDQTEPGFFIAMAPNQVLIEQVASVRVTVTDQADGTSAVTEAMRSPAPLRGLGANCDERGFNRCDEGSLCADMGDQYRCTVIGDARSAACAAALVLNPSAGAVRVRGSPRASLWEPPSGCLGGQETQQPDRVVKLVLQSAAQRLVLSTDHPYTSFDTALFLLDECNESPRLAWCVADQPSGALPAVLELTAVPAGDYYVIVESFPSSAATGDTFELTVTVE